MHKQSLKIDLTQKLNWFLRDAKCCHNYSQVNWKVVFEKKKKMSTLYEFR
ncbi:hypothetical protein DB44_BY00280 [Candidatus Protochlamydia amoebophila]|uniref:Uncharacterized protein n=1 Tax=Candidatus Protochlamydia amoebophila TaxID=362787 RepID=A0A0C1JNU1_9BACT|nr:hypothetical protein DB44_BY00280 [Candidatus Protochlamydia amoebophila]